MTTAINSVPAFGSLAKAASAAAVISSSPSVSLDTTLNDPTSSPAGKVEQAVTSPVGKKASPAKKDASPEEEIVESPESIRLREALREKLAIEEKLRLAATEKTREEIRARVNSYKQVFTDLTSIIERAFVQNQVSLPARKYTRSLIAEYRNSPGWKSAFIQLQKEPALKLEIHPQTGEINITCKDNSACKAIATVLPDLIKAASGFRINVKSNIED